MRKITVSDFTLKAVEEQGLTLTFREKLAIAEKLDSLLVDAIELPILTDSKESEVIYRTIASSIKNAVVKIPIGNGENLNVVEECLKNANNSCLQVIMPVSTAQMEYFYHLKALAMKENIIELCKKAKSLCKEVEFVAKDAFRAEKGFVEDLAKSVYEIGVGSITICDDSGEFFPEDYFNLVKSIKSCCGIKVSIQPSNAFFMAVSSAVKAIEAGADAINTSITGEYLSLSTISNVFRAKKYLIDAECSVDIANVKSVSTLINDVAENATFEESDSKILGLITNTATATDVGKIIRQLGYELSDSDIGKVFDEVKKLTAKKEAIDTKELEAVVASTAMQVPSTYHLINYVVNSGNIIPATANVTLERDGEKFTGVSTGDGPIDAAFHAIEQVIGHHYELDDFQVHAVTKGRGAVGSSLIRLRADGKLYPGNGVSTDIVGACIRAYINALNKIVYEGN